MHCNKLYYNALCYNTLYHIPQYYNALCYNAHYCNDCITDRVPGTGKSRRCLAGRQSRTGPFCTSVH